MESPNARPKTGYGVSKWESIPEQIEAVESARFSYFDISPPPGGTIAGSNFSGSEPGFASYKAKR